MKATKPFATEVDLCAQFLSGVDRRAWVPYPETAGWDILLSRIEDGFQIGVQAKLRLNAAVISQAIEDNHCYYANRAGPDCRAILVPEGGAGDFIKIAGYLGVTIIRAYGVTARYAAFHPALPRPGVADHEWFETAPTKRHLLPDYVPDVAAGASAPVQLTKWKVAALKVAVTAERRGYVTRADFKHFGIDYRRWIAPGYGWLRVEDGRYVPGPRLPDFKAQHPRNYDEIAADFDKWASPAAPPHPLP